MIVRLADRNVRAILLDIEGTTTSIAYVYDELFPYARAHLGAFLRERRDAPDVADVLHRLKLEHDAGRGRGEALPPWRADDPIASAEAYAYWLMDRDRKAPGLKLLQGLVTDRGYAQGELHGHVYPDVPPAMRRWRGAGLQVAIYSSGSELAQRRLFASTTYGDLTPLIVAFFDTSVGAKREPASYGRIAGSLNRAAGEVLFVSDVTAELDAADRAGLQTALSVRPGNPPQPRADHFTRVESLGDIE